MRKFCTIWLIWVVALVAIIVTSAQAHAFYWYGWPGSGVPPDRTIVGPPGGSSKPPPKNPTGTPVVVTNPPPGGTGTEPPGGGSESHPTPEPATGLATLAGLGVLAVVRAFKRRNRVAA
jgi:hypothetical protein